jgi:hypothetical protein|tara:strand:+ start:161 stop:484 length:324 start_codon:yes stop_codon:yes gene_type:complete
MKIITIALLLISFNSYSDKFSWTGVKLRDTCRGKGAADLACLGYYVGIIDAINEEDKGVCLTEGETTVGFSENISLWLENNGSKVEERGVDTVVKALKAYYPCDETN